MISFKKFFQLVQEQQFPTSNYKILFVEDNLMLQNMFKIYLKKNGIILENVNIVDNATDAILYIGENRDITHYSLDYDLAQGEKGSQVAELLAQQGNMGENVWIHSGNPDGRDQILGYIPNASIAPSPDNVKQIVSDINRSIR